MATVICSNGSLYNSPDYLLLFGKVNLANCAAQRARIAAGRDVYDEDGETLFGREYKTAKMWTRNATN